MRAILGISGVLAATFSHARRDPIDDLSSDFPTAFVWPGSGQSGQLSDDGSAGDLPPGWVALRSCSPVGGRVMAGGEGSCRGRPRRVSSRVVRGRGCCAIHSRRDAVARPPPAPAPSSSAIRPVARRSNRASRTPDCGAHRSVRMSIADPGRHRRLTAAAGVGHTAIRPLGSSVLDLWISCPLTR